MSQGSWRWTVSQASSTAPARPPVATTAASPPSSATMRRTIPSTCPAKPQMAPAWRLSTVFLPITDRGTTSSTRRSWAVRSTRAFIEIWMPGAMAAPRCSPRSETASKVVAVPKSTTTTGPP